jgi:hypothetical protein
LPTEGITKTVLIGFGATLADVRQKLMTKLSKAPTDLHNWAFLLTRDIEQMWLDDKVSLKAYNVKDGVSNVHTRMGLANDLKYFLLHVITFILRIHLNSNEKLGCWGTQV